MTAGIEIPNETTLKSFAEGEKMLAEGTGQHIQILMIYLLNWRTKNT